MVEEVWKDIPEHPKYQISSLGRVKSLKTGKVLIGGKAHGYSVVTLSENGRGKTFRVCRLVAKAFLPNPENKPQVDHINTVRDDDRAENLRWVTAKENTNKPITMSKILAEVLKPERLKNLNQTGKKFTAEHKRKIGLANRGNHLLGGKAKRVKCMETQKIYESMTLAELDTGIHATSIGKVCSGERKTAGKLHWSFV